MAGKDDNKVKDKEAAKGEVKPPKKRKLSLRFGRRNKGDEGATARWGKAITGVREVGIESGQSTVKQEPPYGGCIARLFYLFMKANHLSVKVRYMYKGQGQIKIIHNMSARS